MVPQICIKKTSSSSLQSKRKLWRSRKCLMISQAFREPLKTRPKSSTKGEYKLDFLLLLMMMNLWRQCMTPNIWTLICPIWINRLTSSFLILKLENYLWTKITKSLTASERIKLEKCHLWIQKTMNNMERRMKRKSLMTRNLRSSGTSRNCRKCCLNLLQLFQIIWFLMTRKCSLTPSPSNI